MGIIFVAGVASPAAAKDCFIRVRVAEARAAGPVRRIPTHRRAAPARTAHHLHHVRHVVGAGHARRPVIAVEAPVGARNYAESSFEKRTMPVYVMRPTSCDTQPPETLQSLPPAEFKPPAQKLLDALAGPPARFAEAPAAPDEEAPTGAGGSFSPFQPGGLVGAPGVLGGGVPVVGQPVTTPVILLPPDLPPEGLPVVIGPGGGGPPPPPPVILPPPPGVGPVVIVPGGGGPTGGQPPIIPPVILPPPVVVGPEGPPLVGPPEGGLPPLGPPVILPPPPPPPPVTTVVPEPATWGMMILGFLAVGGVVRYRKATTTSRGRVTDQ